MFLIEPGRHQFWVVLIALGVVYLDRSDQARLYSVKALDPTYIVPLGPDWRDFIDNTAKVRQLETHTS